jgi:UDP-N-acetylglucosamine 4,6-dehydratase/5-epimerase
MKKVLITGGAGTVGTGFINQYYKDFKFYNFSRSETHITNLKRNFPNVESIVGDVQDLDLLSNVCDRIKPDIVIHAAALKHVNIAEDNPSKAVEINVVGSLNVIKASIRADVPITIGISTDKACQPENVYGYSKWMMELLFKEYHNPRNKFVCTRFANVVGSNGSVIPFWVDLAQKGQPLRLTDKSMNRLMFSEKEAAELIYRAYEYAQISDKPFVLSKMMQSVNMEALAQSIMKTHNVNEDIQVVGLRPGEKLNETLISEKELGHAFITEDNKYVILYNDEFGKKRLSQELSSLTAQFMTEQELKTLHSH